ncbi:MAG: type II toxin-antitoxin system VapC family toxin [archaeon]|nr:type II toxin-antitoxin system VapC family toxin [archaeon]MCP8313225.1 type II toxin-antitoxin system VapC family toxin [archaeon]MCP8320832.1 type II toxin-antitoxin system VapC family toxin [archaeon]
MVCLDTDILVSLIKGDPKAVSFIKALERKGEELRSTVITAYELLKGAVISVKSDANVRIVKGLLSNITILELDSPSAELASTIYQKLRRKGEIVGEFDILIAAISIKRGEELISNDKDFLKIEDVKVRFW